MIKRPKGANISDKKEKFGLRELKFTELKKVINEKQLKLYWIANQIKVDKRTVSRWVNGKVKWIRYDNLESLSQLLECSPDRLIVENSTKFVGEIDIRKAAAANEKFNLLEELTPSGNYTSILQGVLFAVDGKFEDAVDAFNKGIQRLENGDVGMYEALGAMIHRLAGQETLTRKWIEKGLESYSLLFRLRNMEQLILLEKQLGHTGAMQAALSLARDTCIERGYVGILGGLRI